MPPKEAGPGADSLGTGAQSTTSTSRIWTNTRGPRQGRAHARLLEPDRSEVSLIDPTPPPPPRPARPTRRPRTLTKHLFKGLGWARLTGGGVQPPPAGGVVGGDGLGLGVRSSEGELVVDIDADAVVSGGADGGSEV